MATTMSTGMPSAEADRARGPLGMGGVLLAVTLPHLTISLGAGGLSVLMPLLQRDLHLSQVGIGVLGGARFVGLILLSIPAAALVGAVGLRRSITLLQVLFGVTLLGLAAARGQPAALLAVVTGGACLAASNPATTTAVILRFPPGVRAQAMNTKQVGVPLGQMVAALTLPAVAALAGWRGAFVLVAAGAAAGGALSWILYGPGDGARALALGRSAPGVRALLRERAVMRTTVVQGLMMVGQASMLAYFVVYLVARAIPLAAAAGYLALLQLAGTAGRVFWGFATQHGFRGRRRPALISVIVVAAAGVASLAVVPARASPWLLGVVSVLLGLGLMAWAGMVELVRAELVDSHATAAATGVGYALSSVGAIVGPPLFGLVTQWWGYPAGWTALAAVLAAAALVAAALAEPSLAPPAAETVEVRSG